MGDPTAADLGPYAAGVLGLLSSFAAALRFSGRLSDVEAKTKASADQRDKDHAENEVTRADVAKLRAEVAALSNAGPSSVSGAGLRAMAVDVVTSHLSSVRAEVSGALTSFRGELERLRGEHERDRTEGRGEWKQFYRLVGKFEQSLKEKDED